MRPTAGAIRRRCIYRRRDDEPGTALGGGLPEPLPAMPYALVAYRGRLSSPASPTGSSGRARIAATAGERHELEGDPLTELHALVHAD